MDALEKKRLDDDLVAKAIAASEPDLSGPNPFASPSSIAGRRMEPPVIQMDPIAISGKRDPFQPPPSNVAPTMKMAALDIAGKLPAATGGSGVPDDVKAFLQPTAATPQHATPPVTYADKDLMAAQDLAAQQRLWAGLSRAGAMAAAGLNGRQYDKSAFDALDANADQPVKDYAAQKDAATKNKAAAEASALKDPNSAVSKAFQARIAKLLPGQYSPEDIARLTAADSDNVLSYGKMKAELDQRKAEAETHAKEFAATQAQHQTDQAQNFQIHQDTMRNASADRKAQRDYLASNSQLERDSREAIAAAANATALEKDRAAKAAAATPLPPEAVKAVNQLQAVGALARLKKAHDETNGTGVLTSPFPGNTAANRYHDQLMADSSALAAGILPQGRETPGAVEMIHGMVPGAMTGSARAAQQFRSHRDNLLGNARAQIETLAASGKYDKGQVNELRRQLAIAEEQGKSIDGDPSGPATQPQVIELNGKRYQRGPNGEAIPL